MPRLSHRSLPAAGLMLMVIVLSFCIAWSASAQAPSPTIGSASLRLWPEYDDPGLLVIFAGTITGTATYPLEVAFPMPASARGIQATVVDAAGSLFNQPWQVVNGKLVYALTGPAFHVEYYVDLPRGGDQRSIAYSFESPYAIRDFEASVQQPARATAFSVSPQPAQSVQGSDNFTYFLIPRNNVAAGEKVAFTIRYSKSDQGLSVAQTNVTSAQPAAAPPATSSTDSLRGLLPYFLIGFGVVALGVAAIYAIQQRRAEVALAEARAAQRQPKPRPARSTAPAITPPVAGRPAGGGKPANASAVANQPVFCTQCGHKLAIADRFCPQCGTAAKRP